MSYAAGNGAPDRIQTCVDPVRSRAPIRSSHRSRNWSRRQESNLHLPGCSRPRDHSATATEMAAPPGSDPGSPVSETGALPTELRGNGQGERVRTSDLRIPSAGLYQAELHPVVLERATGFEPAYSLIRNQMFLQLNYARMFGAAEGLVSYLRRRPRDGSGRWIRTSLILG